MNGTILIVENDDAIRALVGDILANRGYLTLTASSVAEGVARAREASPELVFAAPELADGTASDLMRRLDRGGARALLLLVVAAGLDDPGRAVRAMDAFSYLTVPVDRRRLEFLVTQGLALRPRLIGPGGPACADRADNPAGADDGRLDAVLEAGEDVLLLLDAQGVVIRANRAAARLFGLAQETLAGRLYAELFPESSGEVRAQVEAVRAEGKARRMELSPGGVPCEAAVSPVTAEGRLSGLVASLRDVSARRRIETDLAESEKRYRSIHQAASAAILMIDRNDGSILDCNDSARRLYGYSPEEMLRLNVADLSDEPDRAMAALRAGLERRPLAHHRRRNGQVFPVEVSMGHYRHEGREVCTAIIQDLSHRKAVEEALREGARLYRAVVEDQTELICRYTPEGELTFVNSAYARFFGVDEDEVLGRKSFPKLAEDERRDVRAWLKIAGADRPVFDREQRVRRGDGRERWILWTHRAILDPRGDLLEIQAVGRDITERRDAEQALLRATAEKERYRLNLEATFRSIPDAILTVDSKCRIIATNSAAGSLLGVDQGEDDRKPLEDLLSARGNNPCVSVVKQVLRTHKSVHGYETELDVPAVGVRMVELNCTPLIDQEQRHTGAVLVVRDVSRIVDLEKRLHERHGFRGIIGRSTAMQEIYKLLEQLSSLDSIVLILGESGTGKELVADALHYGGSRGGNPLVKVNCSALSESLLESELFGHVRGAFTGAVRDKVGRIQAAQGGTLFLDEIGDISPLLQLKLLRFLEQKEYERVGESQTRTADVRIIAATNVNLLEAVRAGTFREDLYYRLNVMPVRLPPLRDRQADIPLLAEHFLELFSNQFNKRLSRLSDEVMDLFMAYPWPGNIRELRHILEHACILSPGGEIVLRHVRADLVEQMRTCRAEPRPAAPPAAPGPAQARRTDREAVVEVLERCAGNKARAARMLGIHRATLYRKLAAWGMD
ncbi:PAS domain S-box protein [Pseudodesulfovibrio sp.]|uniref:PAS domain S-box protein n=1 Tax=Pseudodesulfovibrio sp. TaxID=2035812 RepID=UPI00263911CB|nr:PAS domain S-box protein [Pseudodesulfovibrio sp.]MDD3311889.1 PAS domain S-box protein [Pseudodesulfovibrio sp.]